MATMYETIMELPLFKGIGEEQLSLLLEKTKVEFLKYEEGQVIIKPGEKIKHLDFILGGRVRQTYRLDNFDVAVDEILGQGMVMGAVNLYGLETLSPCESVALGKVSVMRISKSDYMNILSTDKIYLLNFVNYLSAGAQNSNLLFRKIKEASIYRELYTLAFSMASRNAETVMVAGDDAQLAAYCGIEEDEFKDWKANELLHNRIMANQRGIFLKTKNKKS